MNPWLLAASAIALLTGIAHSYLGERYILIRLFRRENLPQLFGSERFTERVLRFAWHLTTIAWFGLAIVMLVLGDSVGASRPSVAVVSPEDPDALAGSVGRVIAGTFAISAVVTAGASRGKHLAWPVFAAIAVLTWVGV